MAARNLVIVESPAKARTIEKYLGKDYKVKASMGHLRDLPKSTLGVDVDNDFKPIYEPIKGKEDIISDLRQSADMADMIYLATDPDREGEAISWHLKQLLNLPEERTKRVTFNEITKKVVQESIQSPRKIDQDLVDAQQARRILDRLVGYKLSPLLWKKVRRGLSAGRVQSVATRMVDDRETEIQDFKPEEYWTLDAKLGETESSFSARYYGKKGKKVELHTKEETEQVISETKDETFTIKKIKRSDRKRNPPPPFITSTLQQDASRKLSMSPKRTMMIAQQLYEGVDIDGEGTTGLITYMRTDSLRLSEEAISAARAWITERYGSDYCPAKPNRYRAKNNAQDAHEAIRPTNMTLTPEKVKSDLTREQYSLYRLIWNRFIACQMASAIYDHVSVEVQAGEHIFHAGSSILKFPGYTAVYEEGKDEEKIEKSNSILSSLQEGQAVKLQGYDPQQHFTQPPPRYTDASLIRAMEEQGIGRPSTYAPTISTILDRYYVLKEGSHLRISNLGHVVTELMKQRFPDITDLRFTARMEEKLDSIEEGKTPWKSILRNFYGRFDENLQKAERELEGVRIKIPDETSEEICPLCGRNLVIKIGRFGRFLACPGYPECEFTMPLVEVMPGRCPKCGGRLMKRTGISKNTKRQYIYYCCEHTVAGKGGTASCDFYTWDIPLQDNCPECGWTLFKQSGRGNKKAFCINPTCPNFLPEENRGYKKKDKEHKSSDELKSSKESDTTAEMTQKTAVTKKSSSGKATVKKPRKTNVKASKIDALDTNVEPSVQKRKRRVVKADKKPEIKESE